MDNTMKTQATTELLAKITLLESQIADLANMICILMKVKVTNRRPVNDMMNDMQRMVKSDIVIAIKPGISIHE
jgi:hypothetical protein